MPSLSQTQEQHKTKKIKVFWVRLSQNLKQNTATMCIHTEHNYFCGHNILRNTVFCKDAAGIRTTCYDVERHYYWDSKVCFACHIRHGSESEESDGNGSTFHHMQSEHGWDSVRSDSDHENHLGHTHAHSHAHGDENVPPAGSVAGSDISFNSAEFIASGRTIFPQPPPSEDSDADHYPERLALSDADEDEYEMYDGYGNRYSDDDNYSFAEHNGEEDLAATETPIPPNSPELAELAADNPGAADPLSRGYSPTVLASLATARALARPRHQVIHTAASRRAIARRRELAENIPDPEIHQRVLRSLPGGGCMDGWLYDDGIYEDEDSDQYT